MEKVLIEVKAPAADLVFDVFVPETMQIGTLTQLAASAFSKLSNGVFGMTRDSVLCDQRSGSTFDPDRRVFETDIHNGSKLFLL